MDSLRDGRLIYLFTAVSVAGRGLWLWGTGPLPTGPPGAKCLPPCQGLSKLQELVRYHICDHGQVGGPPLALRLGSRVGRADRRWVPVLPVLLLSFRRDMIAQGRVWGPRG